MTASTLERLEKYYDSAPRDRSRVEEIGPFTLFVATSGWPYYARPRLGCTTTTGVDDAQAVLARQRDLGVPQALEWVDETSPGLIEVVRAAGARVEECPLLVLDGHPTGSAGVARMLTAADRADVAAAQAAIAVSFEVGGTSAGTAGLAARDERVRAGGGPGLDPLLERLAEGKLRMAAVVAPDAPYAGPVGGGSHIPIGDVTEVVGVGVLPAYRRRGLAGNLTVTLAQDALDHGAATVFCSAQSDAVARVYEAVGFRRVGTACIASAPNSPPLRTVWLNDTSWYG